MKLVKWNFWILKEHNNFSYLWNFEPDIPNSFGEIPFANPKIYKERINSLTFCHPVILQFLRAHWYIERGPLLLLSFQLIAKSWNLQKLSKLTGSFLNLIGIQLFREMLSEKNVHATIPKGNMGYEQYTVPDTVDVEPGFVAFLYHSQTYDHGLSCHSFKFLWRTVNSKPPTIPFGVVACTFSDNLSRNSFIRLYMYIFYDGLTRMLKSKKCKQWRHDESAYISLTADNGKVTIC